VVVEGHGDATEGKGVMKLSRARAEAVRARLIALGVAQERLKIEAFGATRPIADSKSEQSRAKNRRVGFRVTDADGNTP
jgi:OOP family OmpA-OmpF porin